MRPETLPTEASVRARLVDADECVVEMVEDGPALVRGATVVADASGNQHPALRPVVGVCTCGLTQRAPWCDATHKVRVQQAGA